MATYIPKQEKLTRERVEAKLETGLIRKLESYCEYLQSDRDYVIAQALEIAFKKDKGFAEWLTAQPSSATAPEPAEEAPPQGRRSRRNQSPGAGNDDVATSRGTSGL
jgi:hypothetical protein